MDSKSAGRDSFIMASKPSNVYLFRVAEMFECLSILGSSIVSLKVNSYENLMPVLFQFLSTCAITDSNLSPRSNIFSQSPNYVLNASWPADDGSECESACQTLPDMPVDAQNHRRQLVTNQISQTFHQKVQFRLALITDLFHKIKTRRDVK